jgi:hypothetical protein
MIHEWKIFYKGLQVGLTYSMTEYGARERWYNNHSFGVSKYTSLSFEDILAKRAS